MASAMDEHVLLEEVISAVDAADDIDKFQKLVFEYVIKVLPILSSQKDGIRKKVMEILLHISKRLKNEPNVQLPVEELLSIFKDPESDSFVTNFSLNYIKMGYPRLPKEKRAKLVPSLLESLDGKPQSHQDGILLLIMPVLGEVNVPEDSEERSKEFGLEDKPAVAKALTSFALDVLLLPYGVTPASVRAIQRSSRSSTSRNSAPSNAQPNPPAIAYPPPGMSEYSLRRVTGENTFSKEELEKIKLGILTFLSSGVLPVEDIVSHLIVGSADPAEAVSQSACFVLTNVIRKIKFNTASIVQPLYQLFLGTARDRFASSNTSSQQTPASRNGTSQSPSLCPSCSSITLPEPSALPPPPTKAELQTTPADFRLRMSLLPYICRSQGSGIIYPDCLQIVYDCLYSADSNLELKFIALEFVIVIICDSSASKLQTVGYVLLSCLLKLIASEGMEVKLLAYLAVGELGVRMPNLVNKDLALLLTFFEALDKETAEVKIAIRDCLLTLMEAFKDLCEGPQRNKLETHLAILVERASEPMARMLAVNYAASLFPPDHAMSRFILLMATGDRQKEVALEAGRALYGFDMEKKSDNSETKQCLPVPSFLRMNLCLSLIAEARVQSNKQNHQSSNPVLPFPLLIMNEMLIYLRMCLLREVKIPATRTVSYHPQYTVPKIRDFLSNLLSAEESEGNHNTKSLGALDKYLHLIQQYLRAQPEFIVLCCLLDLVGSLPDYFAPKFSSNLKWLESFVFSSSEEIREVGAIIYGFVVAHGLDDSDYDQIITNLLRQLGKKNLDTQHGCILAICYCLERRIYLKKSQETKPESIVNSLISRSTYKKGVKAIIPFLEHANPMLVTAACTAIGIIGRCAPLPLPDGEVDESKQEGSGAKGNQVTTKLDVVNKLGAVMVNPSYLNKEGMKVKLEAVKAAGYLCVGENFPHRQLVIKKLFDLAHVQVNVRMEKTMTCCILGPLAFASSDPWKFSKDSKNAVESCGKDESCEKVGTWILDEILTRSNADTCVERRKAWFRWIPVLLRCCTCEREMTKHLQKGIPELVDLKLENSAMSSMPPTLLRLVGSTPSISEHPAPLPLQPMPTVWNPSLKLPPQTPVLKLSKVVNGVVLSWTVNLTPNHEEIEKYQLFAYQESNLPPSTSLWKKVGDVKPLKLPMACTLSQFTEGHRYHFAIRAVDVHARIGPFSKPLSILLSNS
ncbi:proteasome adapter and scaffold protein ECM29-like [Ischnura elegans]|uniref:proteasome adapter and scaffold protein ECM29-like n=1 Tax=Ischnura elegans TaxID=197161 RepID=UPI001ED89EF9|nr:proteasome adapter and scaffold protein ECM29-like [Ischnura elegans]